jgi:tRNA-dihydrouridine synthase B
MKHIAFTERLRESKLMLPPLAGYTDLPYRAILAMFNPPFIVTEMLSAQAVIRRGPKTMRILERTVGTSIKGVQLVGSDPAVLSEAARVIESIGFDYVDINMGCTVGKIVQNGAGISLMKDEERAAEIASEVVDAVEMPVTCKIRIGSSRQSQNAVPLSLKLANAGVAAITVHGRSGEKKFGLPVDHQGIKEVVEAITVPVVANGGIFTGRDAKEMLRKTGAAAVMPGRGLIGNPWLITEIMSTFSGSPYSQPTISEKKEICLLHLSKLCDFYGEKTGALEMRKILPQYFSGCHHLKDLKNDVEKVTMSEEVIALLDRIHGGNSKIFYGHPD